MDGVSAFLGMAMPGSSIVTLLQGNTLDSTLYAPQRGMDDLRSLMSPRAPTRQPFELVLRRKAPRMCTLSTMIYPSAQHGGM